VGIPVEERPGFGAAVEAAVEMPFLLAQPAIDGAGTDGAAGPFHMQRDGEPPLRPGEPQRQQGLEPYRPRIPGRLPNVHEERRGPGPIGRGAPRPPAWRSGAGWPGERPNGSLAMILQGGTGIGAQLRLHRTRRVHVPMLHRLKVLALGLGGHRGLLSRKTGASLVNTNFGATIQSPVTLYVA